MLKLYFLLGPCDENAVLIVMDGVVSVFVLEAFVINSRSFQTVWFWTVGRVGNEWKRLQSVRPVPKYAAFESRYSAAPVSVGTAHWCLALLPIPLSAQNIVIASHYNVRTRERWRFFRNYKILPSAREIFSSSDGTFLNVRFLHIVSNRHVCGRYFSRKFPNTLGNFKRNIVSCTFYPWLLFVSTIIHF